MSVTPAVSTTYTATVWESVNPGTPGTPQTQTFAVGGSTCTGWSTDKGTISGWCGWDTPTVTKICQDRGYNSYVSYAQGGGGGPTCSWYGAGTGWRCDSSCKSCAGQTLTSVTCANPTSPSGGTGPSGAGASAQCSVTVTVNPPTPVNGCIRVVKETYDTNGNPLTPVAQFTFKLDGNAATTQNDSNGDALFSNVTPGTHTVTEVIPNSNWTQLSVTPSNGTVIVPQGPTCATVVFKNKQVVQAPPPITVKATKIVCDSETDLPNWSGGANITASTASDFLATHPNCHAEPNWTFEWANEGTGNPGDNQGAGGSGWTAFATDSNGIATAVINSITGGKIWVREQMKSGYVPFSGVLGGNNSAEMWCHTDVLNYDNYDLIDNPQAGQTYHCVAFNAPEPPPPGDGCINVIKETYDTNGNPLSSVAQFTFNLDGNAATTQNDSNGDARFNGVAPGQHTVTEIVPATWTQLSVTPANGVVTVAPGSSCATVVFKNKQVITTPAPVCSISVSKSPINTGESIDVSWSSVNATSGFITGGVGTTSPVSGGSMTVFPADDTTYTGTFIGLNGKTACSASVDVQIGGGGCQGNCGGGLNQPNVVLATTQKPGEQPFAFVYLSQVPYTGFEAGPVLSAFYWLMLALWSAAAAYAIRAFGLLDLVKRKLSGIVNHSGGYAAVPEEREADENQYAYFSGSAAATFAAPLAAPVRVVTEPQRAAYPSNTVVPASVVSAAAPVITPAPIVEDETLLVDKLETRAHAAGVLVSPEALRFASRLKNDAAGTLKMFGTILEKAVQTYPREEGWVLLSKDRVMTLADEIDGVVITPTFAHSQADSGQLTAESRNANSKPRMVSGTTISVPASLDVSLDVNAFVSAILSGNREQAFGAIRHGRVEELMAGAVTALDSLYRSRVEGKMPGDAVLARAAQEFSGPALENIISILAGAVDATYSSPETAAKLALTKIFTSLS
jgi:hypothetical protein